MVRYKYSKGKEETIMNAQDLKQEMETQLATAKEKYGDWVELGMVKVSPIEGLLNVGYDQDFIDDNKLDTPYVFEIEDFSDWSGYLTGLMIDWHTDYDFESGAFETLTKDDKKMLITMNAFMKEFDDRNWDFEKANEHIKAIDKRYELVPKIIKALTPFEYVSGIIEVWLTGGLPKSVFTDILNAEEQKYGKESRQELATAIDDVVEATGLSYSEAREELDNFNGVTFIY